MAVAGQMKLNILKTVLIAETRKRRETPYDHQQPVAINAWLVLTSARISHQAA